MIGRAVEGILDAQSRWAKPLGVGVQKVLHAIFGPLAPVRDVLNGTWLGHPVHAMLTDAPIGALTLVIILDVLGQRVAADVALVFGVLAMAGSALAGFADYNDTYGRARDRATVHATLMVIALVLYLVSLVIRAGGGADRTVPIALSVVGYIVLIAAAYVGGDVVYALGNMVDRHAWRPRGTKWEPLVVGELAEGQLAKGDLGGQALVLIRQGDVIHALHDACAHANGSLSKGVLVDGCVECPLHGSRFRLADGHVARGPAVYDQPTYEVRPTDAGGWEARRRP